MNIRNFFAGAAMAAAASFGSVCVAEAAVIVTTYKGTVSSGVDQLGLFGAPGGVMTGAAYTAVYVVDDSGPDMHTSETWADCESTVHACSGAVGSISINGHTFDINKTTLAGFFSSDGAITHIYDDPAVDIYTDVLYEAVLSGVHYHGHDEFFSLENMVGMYNYDFLDPSYKAPFSFTNIVLPYAADGSFTVNHSIPGTDDVVATDLRLTVTSVVQTVDGVGAAVPEPATWALMLCGFFSAGAALRGQRSRRAAES